MKIDARSPDGNVFAIMAYVRRLFRDADRKEEWPDVQRRMMEGDCDNACDVAEAVTFGAIQIVNRVND